MPHNDWMLEWMKRRPQLSAKADLNLYFESEQLNGHPLSVTRLGRCTVPSGKMLVRDPLTDLANPAEKPYFEQTPVGHYPVELSVFHDPIWGRRCAAVRMLFNYQRPVNFVQALVGTENIQNYSGGIYGFFSDTGWGALCDEKVHQVFCQYVNRWNQQHPGQSFQKQELSSKLNGDFLDFVIPETEYHISMFRAGSNAPRFPVYWGEAPDGRICQLVVWMIDLNRHDSQIPETERVFYDMAEDMPELQWKGYNFQGPIRLRVWNEYFHFDDMIHLTLKTGKLDNDRILDECEHFFAAQYRILDIMMEALLDRYPLMQVEYGHFLSDNSPRMPNITGKGQFGQLMYPRQITLDIGQSQWKLAAGFVCSWDKDGLGIVMEGDNVVKIGTAENVFSNLNF